MPGSPATTASACRARRDVLDSIVVPGATAVAHIATGHVLRRRAAPRRRPAPALRPRRRRAVAGDRGVLRLPGAQDDPSRTLRPRARTARLCGAVVRLPR